MARDTRESKGRDQQKTDNDESQADRRRRRARFLAELAQDRELVERVYPRAAARRRGQRRLATYRY